MTTIRHAPDCTGPDVHEVTGRRGDLLARCTRCGWFLVLEDAEPAHEPAAKPRRAPARLVCREHHDEPVTARGKGCRKCDRHRHRDPERTETE